MGSERDVVIIGAGFSGIGVASSLDRAGMSDFETMWRARRFPLADYRLERLPVRAAADAVAA